MTHSSHLTIWLTVWLMSLFCTTMQAQSAVTSRDEQTSFHVSGRVFGIDDESSKPYPLPNAHVRLVCLNDTDVTTVAVTKGNGEFMQDMSVVSRRVKKDDVPRVRMMVTYVGYDTLQMDLKTEYLPAGRLFKKLMADMIRELGDEKAKELNIDISKIDDNDESIGKAWQVDVDSIVLRCRPMTTEEVQIVGELTRMYVSGDTTVFNVDAFEMPRGTVLLNLVRRLPGLKYENGLLTYRDSVIREIRLNGESFFAHDMRIALENIENADLKQFRVYRTQDDTLNANGQKHLVADMITKNPVNRVEVAKPEVGTSTVRNTYHLAAEGLQWKSGGKGEWNASVRLDDLPSVHSKKYGWNEVEGSYSRRFGKTSVRFRPNYRYTDSRNTEETLNSYTMPDYEQYDLSSSGGKSYSNDISQNIYLHGNSKNNSASWDFSTDYGYYDSRSRNHGESASYSGNPFTDGGGTMLTGAALDSISLNRSSRDSRNKMHQQTLNLGGSVSYRFKGNSTFIYPSLQLRVNIKDSHSYTTSTERQHTDYLQYTDSVWSYHRRSIMPTESEHLDVSASYEFYLGKNLMNHTLSFGYRFGHDNEDGDVVYYDLQHDMQQLDSLSNSSHNQTDEHNMSIDYRFYGKKLLLYFDASLAPTRSTYSFNRRDGISADTTLHAILPHAQLQLTYKLGEHYNVSTSYSFNTHLPPLSQVVRPVSNDDPLHIQQSNPDLKKPVSHSINLSFTLGNYWWLNSHYAFNRNSVDNRTTYDTKTGATISRPENIDGNWNLSTGVGYHTGFRHANLSINARHGYSHHVNYLQTNRDATSRKGTSDIHNISLTPQFVLYTKHYDLTLDANYNYEWSRNDYLQSTDDLHSYNLGGKFNYWLGDRFTLSSDLDIAGRAGNKMYGGNKTDIIWNMGVELKVLRNYRGLIKLQWQDILRERRNYSSSITSTGRYERRTSGNPHYVLLTFQYKFYKMKE